METNTQSEDRPKSRKVVYNPTDGDPLAVTWHGHRFVKGVPVEVPTSNEGLHGAVDGNPAFSFEGQDKAAEAEERAKRDAEVDAAERKAIAKHEREAMEVRHKSEREAMDTKHGYEEQQLRARHGDDGAGTEPEPVKHDEPGEHDEPDAPGFDMGDGDEFNHGANQGHQQVDWSGAQDVGDQMVGDPMRNETRVGVQSVVNAPTAQQRAGVGGRAPQK